MLKFVIILMAMSTLSAELPNRIAASKWANEMSSAFEAAREAARVLYDIQHEEKNLAFELKDDFSPVTIADQQANEIICKILHDHFPDYGILTEEKVTDPDLQPAVENWRARERTWIIDPLDGTQAFIDHGKGYGIHIGLTYLGEPVMGINYYPETQTAYFAVLGCGAYKQVGEEMAAPLAPQIRDEILPIRNSNQSETASIYRVLFGQEITPEIVERHFQKYDSCGMKFCAVAEGFANVFLSSGLKGGLWDFCSGQVIILESGGQISDFEGNPIDYRNPDARLEKGVVICNNIELYRRVLQIYD